MTSTSLLDSLKSANGPRQTLDIAVMRHLGNEVTCVYVEGKPPFWWARRMGSAVRSDWKPLPRPTRDLVTALRLVPKNYSWNISGDLQKGLATIYKTGDTLPLDDHKRMYFATPAIALCAALVVFFPASK